ncbi:acyl-[acyl-carrier-protein]--UDP-N-acetylglucosamine O-acyltransferase [Verrucomicrobium sp. GAS474]|uniref:acyl-ACP--UDP-N-acetylglucosamine O-acyltransferase n=1 Tax=Verrucomicrobium sp. GAS474 TaxID=1882831 RepID=UPI00087D961F|nr:acyl-ACP--UDP-N-acetylglucosamine O-acyltransferase [Verrucomicrobium sp. GAS474]SDT96729.1 acyl-[acyl-carrier-protein]--UDP-N-acetylglucosamine O-acyltransferase [Verrucomicrobium sp. GAS474]
MAIHPTAVVEPGARLGVGVEVGAYAVIGSEVVLGDRCRVGHHASLTGKTEIGPDNVFYSFVSIGERTQDLKYKDEPTYLKIGARNTFREFVTANRATAPGGATVIGDDNVFLAYCHFAHDVKVGNHCIFSNNATLGGHVTVEDHVVIGGVTAIHQFCRIGRHAMLGGCTKIVQDALPYFITDGNPAEVRSLNAVGLQRSGFSEESVRILRKAHRLLCDESLNTTQALARIESECEPTDEIKNLLAFIRASERGVIR